MSGFSCEVCGELLTWGHQAGPCPGGGPPGVVVSRLRQPIEVTALVRLLEVFQEQLGGRITVAGEKDLAGVEWLLVIRRDGEPNRPSSGLWKMIQEIYGEDCGLAIWSDPRFASISAAAKAQHEQALEDDQ